ncbi:claudin-11-like [Vanacampus margaritifer]
MAKFGVLLCGFALSFLGWLGIVIATATNDWVVLCQYGQLDICSMMDVVWSTGPWAECVSSTRLQRCLAFQIFDLPAYVQTARALMVTASILGLVAMVIVAMSMPCTRLGTSAQGSKNKHAAAGGVLMLIVGLCGAISTVWFSLGMYLSGQLMSFGYSLYAGWVGVVLSLLAAVILTCCSLSPSARPYQEGRKMVAYTVPAAAPPAAVGVSSNHAKSVHV